eukprot:scaffold44427_cov229-Amphora_coffeaeformis.AAC.3
MIRLVGVTTLVVSPCHIRLDCKFQTQTKSVQFLQAIRRCSETPLAQSVQSQLLVRDAQRHLRQTPSRLRFLPDLRQSLQSWER